MNSRSIAWLVGSLCAALIVIGGIISLRMFVLNPYRVPTGGMSPTIRPGAVIWGYKLAYFSASDVRRTDLVFHRAKGRDGKVEVYVKRVIGIPGDRVRTAGRRVFVNDVELTQTYLKEEGSLSVYEEAQDGVRHQIALQLSPSVRQSAPDVDITVPPDSFFVLGDNRMNSLDSRYTGCIHWEDIGGKIVWLQ